MPKYTVTSPIKFKGKRREIDSIVEMSEEDAQPLLASGALQLPVAAEKKSTKKETPAQE